MPTVGAYLSELVVFIGRAEECLKHPRRCNTRAERDIAARQPFGKRDNVRLHTPVLAREHFPSPSKAGNYFVKDEQ